MNAQTYTDLIARSFAERRLVMLLLAAFAGLALVLACIGVYSVMAYVVSQRTAEIGIRMALGASPHAVQAMILGEGLRLTAIGIGLGLVIALAASRLLNSSLRRAGPRPLIYGGISLLLAAWPPLLAGCRPAARPGSIRSKPCGPNRWRRETG
ncbi:MAG: FtsX-like permease family protein [Lacunisphaera sp.]